MLPDPPTLRPPMSHRVALLAMQGVVPFDLSTVLRLAIAVLVPIAPLLLTMISLEELLSQMLKVMF